MITCCGTPCYIVEVLSCCSCSALECLRNVDYCIYFPVVAALSGGLTTCLSSIATAVKYLVLTVITS